MLNTQWMQIWIKMKKVFQLNIDLIQDVWNWSFVIDKQ